MISVGDNIDLILIEIRFETIYTWQYIRENDLSAAVYFLKKIIIWTYILQIQF